MDPSHVAHARVHVLGAATRHGAANIADCQRHGVIVTTTTTTNISTRIASRLEQSVGARRYAMWFDRSARFDYCGDDRTLRVAVPNQFVADWIGRNFGGELQQAAADELGEDVSLQVEVEPSHFADADASRTTARVTTPSMAAAAPAPARASVDSDRATPVHRLRHRLEDFVVGPSNELGYAAAERLADDDGQHGHPLFIHGGCGLGKTHLLQGVCRRVLEQQPDARVLYTTGEQFTNDYITAVRSNKLEAFRKRIRQLEVLAVDDVHFIANKQATQQEFLHSFDQIELGGARVVLASDSHPKLIKQFSEALVSRCVRGLVVPIRQPDAATRIRLVEVLAERRGLPLQPSVARSLGQRSTGSVREIEGLLTKLAAVVALARQNGQRVPNPIGHALVDPLLDGEEAAHTPARPVRFEQVLAMVAEELNVTPQQVLGRSRHRLVVLARSLAIHLTRQLTPMSYPEIAAAMDRGNHSTVITAAQRVQKQIAEDEMIHLPPEMEPITLSELVDRLRRQIVRGG